MPYETILFTVTGTNAQAQNQSVLINPNGTGSATFTYTGSLVGTDIIQASYPGRGLVSNQVAATWDPPVPALPTGANPPWEYSFFTQSSNTPAMGNGTNWTTPGYYATFYYSDTFGEPGPSEQNGGPTDIDPNIQVGNWVYVQFSYGGVTYGPYYAPIIEVGQQWPPSVVHWFNYFCIDLNGLAPAAAICQPPTGAGGQPTAITSYTAVPASSVPTPPAASSLAGGSAGMTLTLASPPQPGAVGGLATVNLAISGINFTATPYIPLLQGTPGQLYISDASGSPGTFNFPPIPTGASINRTAAAGLFSIAGDTSGRLSVVPTSTGYEFYYNGAAPDPGIASTAITVTYDQFAWYNSNSGQFNTEFDLYAVTSTGGGSTANLTVTWLVTQPSAPGVTGTTLASGASSQQVWVGLASPLPPVQQSANPQFTISSPAFTITDIWPTVNGQGFLEGWTLFITTESVGSTTGALNLTLTDTQDYLSGATFVTNGALTYISGQIATLTIG
jgi:hypothetical protein